MNIGPRETYGCERLHVCDGNISWRSRMIDAVEDKESEA